MSRSWSYVVIWRRKTQLCVCVTMSSKHPNKLRKPIEAKVEMIAGIYTRNCAGQVFRCIRQRAAIPFSRQWTLRGLQGTGYNDGSLTVGR